MFVSVAQCLCQWHFQPVAALSASCLKVKYVVGDDICQMAGVGREREKIAKGSHRPACHYLCWWVKG